MSSIIYTVEAIEEFLKGQDYSNGEIVQFILVWENNPFIEDQMRERLLQNSKEKNIETLLTKLEERYDIYTVSYCEYFQYYKKIVTSYTAEEYEHLLGDNFRGIINDVILEFDLTFRATEKEQRRNREQVELLSAGGELGQECREYIERRLNELIDNSELVEDTDIETLMNSLFNAIMVDMLYMKEENLSYDAYKKFLEVLNLTE